MSDIALIEMDIETAEYLLELIQWEADEAEGEPDWDSERAGMVLSEFAERLYDEASKKEEFADRMYGRGRDE